MERRVEMTGWSSVALGAVCLLLAALEAAIPLLLRRISAALASGDSGPLRAAREAFDRGAATSASVNLVFGVLLAVVGIAVARRVRWGHAAMTAAAWASIPSIVAIAKPSLDPLFAVAGDGGGTRGALTALAGALLVAQVAAVLWFLRFWRKAEVRALFR